MFRSIKAHIMHKETYERQEIEAWKALFYACYYKDLDGALKNVKWLLKLKRLMTIPL